MRILYVAKHGQQMSNDDEGAIAHALKFLGHSVVTVHENDAEVRVPYERADLILFHKWCDPNVLARFRGVKAFWYFDLVDFPDPTLAGRCNQRREWMNKVCPLVDVGFCTDGDWVSNAPEHYRSKLEWLPQGADIRVIGPGSEGQIDRADVLFVGEPRGGQRRESFHREMQLKYGSRYRHIPFGTYGRRLADVIANVPIVVAPDGPVTDWYWSNRVYTMAGFGACLVHPFCLGLSKQYAHSLEVAFYTDREQLHHNIQCLLDRPAVRRSMAEGAVCRTKEQHLYLHRCQRLIEVVRERGLCRG